MITLDIFQCSTVNRDAFISHDRKCRIPAGLIQLKKNQFMNFIISLEKLMKQNFISTAHIQPFDWSNSVPLCPMFLWMSKFKGLFWSHSCDCVCCFIRFMQRSLTYISFLDVFSSFPISTCLSILDNYLFHVNTPE
jgi:hypothetical protein